MTEQGPDHDEDEGYTACDEDVVIDERVHVVQAHIDRVNAIPDPQLRLAEARKFVDEMNAGT